MTAIRLVLSDVDGTLVTKDKALTEAAKAAVADLAAAGIAFAVISSRPARGLSMLIEPLRLTQPVAGFNGGLLADPKDLSVIESHPIDPAAAARMVDFLTERDLDVWVYTEDDWFVCDPKGAHVEREAFILQYPPKTVRRFGPEQTDRAFKVVGVSDDPAALAEAEAAAAPFLHGAASAARSSGHFLDVTHPLANKGEVVKTLARRLKIDPAAIATIGDSDNDTLMFAKGGLSIAMGNADADVKAKADHVTAANDQDGFAQAVRRFILFADSDHPPTDSGGGR